MFVGVFKFLSVFRDKGVQIHCYSYSYSCKKSFYEVELVALEDLLQQRRINIVQIVLMNMVGVDHIYDIENLLISCLKLLILQMKQSHIS